MFPYLTSLLCSLGFDIFAVTVSRKWSDSWRSSTSGEQMKCTGYSLVITQSRIWPWQCWLTDWDTSVELQSSNSCLVSLFSCLSKWKLKSSSLFSLLSQMWLWPLVKLTHITIFIWWSGGGCCHFAAAGCPCMNTPHSMSKSVRCLFKTHMLMHASITNTHRSPSYWHTHTHVYDLRCILMKKERGRGEERGEKVGGGWGEER